MKKAQLVKNPDGRSTDCIAMAENSSTNVIRVENGSSNGQELYEDRLGRRMNNEKNSPLDELDEVARREGEQLKWQFQSIHKEYASEYCKDKLVKDAKSMVDSDTASMAMHDTFASYKTKSSDAVDAKVQYASNADDLKVIQATETYAASGGLLPVGACEKNAATPAKDWLERMKEEDARMQRAMVQNDGQMFHSQ